MTGNHRRPQDAAPGEDVASTSQPTSSAPLSPNRIPESKQRNACTPTNISCRAPCYANMLTPYSSICIVTALMSPSSSTKPPRHTRSPPPSVPLTDPARDTTFFGRNGLGAYISSPESFPASRVIYHTPKYVLITDLYPKSSVHLLLLARSPEKMFLHPFEAFEDTTFRAETLVEVTKAKILVAKELRRQFGKFSAQDQLLAKQEQEEEEAAAAAELDAIHEQSSDDDGRLNAQNKTPSPKKSHQRGRDWSQEIISGVHTVPSMTHLHIHILSRDRHSACLKHRKHYNSFSPYTGFLVPLEELPLDRRDKRRRARSGAGRAEHGSKDEGSGSSSELGLRASMKCWRCGKEFGNRFAALKVHLDEEFEVWKRE